MMMMMANVTFITIIRFIIRYRQGRTSVKTGTMRMVAMMMVKVTFITIIRLKIRCNRAAHQ